MTVRWLTTRYHTPKDDLHQPIDLEAARLHARAILAFNAQLPAFLGAGGQDNVVESLAPELGEAEAGPEYRPLTYDQLRRRRDRAAAGLAGLGLRKGDRLGLLTDPRFRSEYHLVRKIDRNGRVIDFAYDSLSRQTPEAWYDNVTDAEAEKVFEKAVATMSDGARLVPDNIRITRASVGGTTGSPSVHPSSKQNSIASTVSLTS